MQSPSGSSKQQDCIIVCALHYLQRIHSSEPTVRIKNPATLPLIDIRTVAKLAEFQPHCKLHLHRLDYTFKSLYI